MIHSVLVAAPPQLTYTVVRTSPVAPNGLNDNHIGLKYFYEDVEPAGRDD